MFICGDDWDVELFKLYLLLGYYGIGVVVVLMYKVLVIVVDWGVFWVWLGVN